MAKQVSVIMVALLAGCTPTPTRTPAPEIQAVAREAMELCIPGDDDVTRCPTPNFRQFGLACLACGKDLHQERAAMEALKKTGALDARACELRKAELQAKLDSPWRSWWLWALIGGAATAATLSGIYWGAD